MSDTLLTIAIACLAVLLILVCVVLIIILKKRKSVDGGGGVSNEEVRKLLEDHRVSTLKDFNDGVAKQNLAINTLKEAIANGMGDAQKTNQKDLYTFLAE
ncbi:MAG TPA: hypothetical protein PKH35_02910, partial [Bacilli bacterium]|nr:hypothetical protein [Bacilli bacterium]